MMDKNQTKKQNSLETRRHTPEDQLYILGLWCLPVLAAAALFYQYVRGRVSLPALPCVFHALTGYYCPGCGGTRAVYALLHFQLLRAFLYHPLVGYAAGMYLLFMVSQTLERLSRHRLPLGMKWDPAWLWLALAILVGNVLIKNGALFFRGIDLFKWIP
jgi:hypothetical protein